MIVLDVVCALVLLLKKLVVFCFLGVQIINIEDIFSAFVFLFQLNYEIRRMLINSITILLNGYHLMRVPIGKLSLNHRCIRARKWSPYTNIIRQSVVFIWIFVFIY